MKIYVELEIEAPIEMFRDGNFLVLEQVQKSLPYLRDGLTEAGIKGPLSCDVKISSMRQVVKGEL